MPAEPLLAQKSVIGVASGNSFEMYDFRTLVIVPMDHARIFPASQSSQIVAPHACNVRRRFSDASQQGSALGQLHRSPRSSFGFIPNTQFDGDWKGDIRTDTELQHDRLARSTNCGNSYRLKQSSGGEAIRAFLQFEITATKFCSVSTIFTGVAAQSRTPN